MAYYATLAYFALYYIRPFEWSPSFQEYPVFSIFGGVGFLWVLFSKLRKGGRMIENGTDLMMTGFLFAICMSHISHAWFGGAMISLIDFLPTFVGYFLVAHSLDSEKKLNGFISVVILCTVVMAVAGIIQYHTGSPVAGAELLVLRDWDAFGRVISEQKRIRWLGTFNDPNDLALAFVLVIPFLLNRLSEKKRLFSLASLFLVVYAIYLTNSRGAVLALAVSLTAYFVIRKGNWKGAVLAAVVVLLIALFGPSRVRDMSAVDQSTLGRLEAWYEGFQILKGNPVFGAGANTFNDFNSLTAHNSFILVIAELGLFGAFFFTGLFYFPIYLSVRVLSNEELLPSGLSPIQKGMYTGLLSSLCGVLTSMFFLSRSYTLLPYMVVGMLIAYPTVLMKERNTGIIQARPYSMKDFRNIVLLEIITIVSINVLLKLMIK